MTGRLQGVQRFKRMVGQLSDCVARRSFHGRDHEGLETALEGRMPLQRDSLSAHRATLALDGLPLHRLPEDERQRLSLSIAVPANGFELTRGETVLGGLSRDMHHFCPRCMSWMFTGPIGMDWFVNVRATMLDEHGWFGAFRRDLHP
jgi:hypothetical protein